MRTTLALALSGLLAAAACSDDPSSAIDGGQAADTPSEDVPVTPDADTGPGDTGGADTDTAAPPDVTPPDVTVDAAPDALPDAVTDTAAPDAVDAISDTGAAEDVPLDAGVPDADATDAGAPDTTPEDLYVLDPATLTFFSLPIGSIRYAVSGYSPKAGACVTIQWFGSGMQCDPFSSPGPYVVVTPSEGAPCGQWDYSGNATVTAVSGCVDFAESWTPVAQDFVDVDVTIESAALTGTVRASNRSLFESKPVVLGLQYQTDVPEDVFVQTGDDYGLPTWATVRKDGAPLLLFDQCDLPICGEGGGACGIAEPKATNITYGDYQGAIYELWDGLVRVEEPGQGCRIRVPAEPGEYEATFCFGWSAEGGTVQSPTCVDVPFTYPEGSVIHHADYGG